MPQGNYRYKRLPMGITPTSKTFQAKMIKQIQGINRVSIIQDDCLETTKSKPSITTTRICKHTCRERNIKINLDKCKFLTEEVIYMCYTMTNADLKLKEKVWAITEFPGPHDLHHLRYFIGIVKYLSKFDQSLTTKCEPLNRLTWKDQAFQQVEVQQRVFEDKESYSEHTCLNLQ